MPLLDALPTCLAYTQVFLLSVTFLPPVHVLFPERRDVLDEI
jgi:hypothetical protein